MTWPLTYHNTRRINIEKGNTSCTADLQKHNFTNIYKWINCVGNCITVSVASVWRVRRLKTHIENFSEQGHDTCTKTPFGLYSGLCHLRIEFECTFSRYNFLLFPVFFSVMFWVSELLNQNAANAFSRIRKYLLFCKIFQLAPTKPAHWSTNQLMSHYRPLMLRFPPQWTCTVVNLICIHLHEWNWDNYGLHVMKCSGSVHYWMQSCDKN